MEHTADRLQTDVDSQIGELEAGLSELHQRLAGLIVEEYTLTWGTAWTWEPKYNHSGDLVDREHGPSVLLREAVEAKIAELPLAVQKDISRATLIEMIESITRPGQVRT